MVVLPAPLGPMMPKISPSDMEKEISSAATMAPYLLLRWLIVTTAFLFSGSSVTEELQVFFMEFSSGVNRDHSTVSKVLLHNMLDGDTLYLSLNLTHLFWARTQEHNSF